MRIYKNIFNNIISLENLFLAWTEFRCDKGKKFDVQRFEFSLEQNIFQLHNDLKNKTYRHGPYSSFYIRDPKVRHIHKAIVRDRVLHHAIFRILNPIFEPTFIPTSFSCRIGKGTHKGVLALESMVRKESKNCTRQCLALKCDIKKFFASIDHEILFGLCKKRICDAEAVWLIDEVIRSYSTVAERE
jgi:RNA-directed DNA polymerase